MLRIIVVTLFPAMLEAITRFGITQKAIENGLVSVQVMNPRDFATDSRRTVDDRPYGGGPGMIMMAEPLRECIQAARKVAGSARTIYLSPQGRRLDQAGVRALAETRELILVAGRYEGIDERVIATEVDEEVSIGDYVLSGGEIPAMVVIDAVTRWLPGALGHECSAAQDSFSAGILDCPHYTRPEVSAGQRVPGVLLGGNHERIRRWRLKQALGRTWLRRPDLLQQRTLDEEQRTLLDEFIAEHSSS